MEQLMEQMETVKNDGGMSWEMVKLGDIVKMVTGKTPPTSNLDYFDGGYLWVNPSDFGSKYIIESKRTITQKAVDEKKCNLLPKETILLSCIGDIGKIGILKTHGSSNQQITGLIAKENVFPDYLFYYLMHNKSKEWFFINYINFINLYKLLYNIKFQLYLGLIS